MISSATQKHLFYSEMAKLLSAGLDIRRAAAVLLDTQPSRSQVLTLQDLSQGLKAGKSITDSISNDGKSISDLERHIISAGERGGKIATAFQHLADYFGMIASARGEMIKGLIYPLLVLHVGIILGGLPVAIIQGGKSTTEILIGMMLTLGVIYLCGFLIFLAARVLLKIAPKNARIDRLINRIPWIGSVRRNIAMARFCKVYHSCILAGISMNETTELATNSAQSGAILEAGTHLIATAKSGNPLGPTFLAQRDFPKHFARSYATGEEAGTLDDDLARWAKIFQDAAESSAKTASVMLPKLLYFFILAFIAWQIITAYSTYYQMLDQIGSEPFEE